MSFFRVSSLLLALRACFGGLGMDRRVFDEAEAPLVADLLLAAENTARMDKFRLATPVSNRKNVRPDLGQWSLQTFH